MVPWKLKCLVFHTVARVPPVYKWMQRHVTGRYFLTVTDEVYDAYAFHLRNFRGGRALEFGAGTNLLCSLLLSHAGATEVSALDLNRLASPDRVNHVIRQLRERLGGSWPDVVDLDADLYTKYRIRYLAPADARGTGLPTRSIDFICSTSVLEHIPEDVIGSIMRECRRLASPDAVLSFIIDYHDHYATADPSISRFNFYRYDSRRWRLFNPPNHFQNRLRHSDYARLFAHFDIVGQRRIIPEGEDISVNIAPEFHHYSSDDLHALCGLFTLRLPKSAVEAAAGESPRRVPVG